MRSKTIFLLALMVCLALGVKAQPQQADPRYLLKGKNYVESKNYYLLSLLQRDPAAKKILQADTDLRKICNDKIGFIKSTLDCKDLTCFTASLKFSADEIKLAGEKLGQLYQPNNALGLLVKNDLIPSGAYVINKALSPKEQLIKAWEQDAEGINYIISIYTEGKKPKYAAIDSISFDIKDKAYPSVLTDASAAALYFIKNDKLFFEPLLHYALQALQINGRNDAANFEPLQMGVNKTIIPKIKKTLWSKYKYSAILILGSGPTDLITPISAVGMLRSKMGAARYFAGLAPFIIVSGGMAHPYKTKYCEAVEMKKYLVEQLHVPADAVICETQARHTTTNVRNSVRIIYRSGIPADKPFLAVSTKSHITYVADQMAVRCLRELRTVPYTLGKPFDDNALELYPSLNAMQINPTEPLDPK